MLARISRKCLVKNILPNISCAQSGDRIRIDVLRLCAEKHRLQDFSRKTGSISDRPEPMEVDGTIRLSRAISRAPKTSVKVRRKRKKRDDYSDYDLQQKRKKF